MNDVLKILFRILPYYLRELFQVYYFKVSKKECVPGGSKVAEPVAANLFRARCKIQQQIWSFCLYFCGAVLTQTI
jgi:hypothetical protein